MQNLDVESNKGEQALVHRQNMQQEISVIKTARTCRGRFQAVFMLCTSGTNSPNQYNTLSKYILLIGRAARATLAAVSMIVTAVP